MLRRSVRIFVLLLTLAVTAGVVWKATTNEQMRGRARLASQQTDATAADALYTLADIRSSLHAYVAPGQGYDFWSARAKSEIDALRARLTELNTRGHHCRLPARRRLRQSRQARGRRTPRPLLCALRPDAGGW